MYNLLLFCIKICLPTAFKSSYNLLILLLNNNNDNNNNYKLYTRHFGLLFDAIFRHNFLVKHPSYFPIEYVIWCLIYDSIYFDFSLLYWKLRVETIFSPNMEFRFKLRPYHNKTNKFVLGCFCENIKWFEKLFWTANIAFPLAFVIFWLNWNFFTYQYDTLQNQYLLDEKKRTCTEQLAI